MTRFGTQACVYDRVGNPTTYRGKTASWTRGRKLISYNGTTFEYDAQGRRTKKDDVTFYYDSNGRLLKQSNGLEFFYDTMGLIGVMYDNVRYVYRKDVQGNIIAILDSTGKVVVEYKYDAWGNHKVLDSNGNDVTSGIGVLNPFRYRSYYYDTETELYYLQTRYYDPEVGRFINMDSVDYADPETINGLNLYSYCNNNPVMNIDPEGTWSWKGFWRVLAAVAIVAVVAVATAVTAGAAAVAIAGAAGASVGTALLAGATVATTALASGLVTGIGEICNQSIEKGTENINLGSVAISTLSGSLDGAMVAGASFAGPLGKLAIATSRIGVSSLMSFAYGKSEKYTDSEIRSSLALSAMGTAAANFMMAIPSKIGTSLIATKTLTTVATKYSISTAKLIYNHFLKFIIKIKG